VKTVSFTRMEDGTFEDYQLLAERSAQHDKGLVDRVLALLKGLEPGPSGYQIDRYQHSLQTATRALRDRADEELVVCALLHDIGDNLAPENHATFAASVLRPYVSDENWWLVDKHGIFQGHYFWHHYGQDRNAREKFRGHPAFEKTALFCERWDQTAFDPGYDTLPLEAFEPQVRRIFARPPYQSLGA
jgi:predicted HD phosphohydrolase